MRLFCKKILSIATVAAILITMLIPCIALAADEPIPVQPAFYYGALSVKSGSATLPMAKGASITAYYMDDGQKVEVGSLVTTEDGKYGGPSIVDKKLMINGNNKLSGGEQVTISVNGVDAKTITYNPGTIAVLDLVVADTAKPVISGMQPAAGTTVGTTPAISAVLSDAGSGIKVSTIKMKLDGKFVAAQATATSVSYTPATALALGDHTVVVTVSDNEGNAAEATWSFKVGEVVLPSPSPSPNPPPTGGGGGGTIVPLPSPSPSPSPVPASKYNESVKDSAGNTLFTRPVTVEGTNAKAALTAEDIAAALNSAAADEDGVKTVVIEFPDIAKVTSYKQDFPAAALSGEAGNIFALKCSVASVDLTSDMFTADAAGNAKVISIILSKAGTTGLSTANAKLIVKRPVIDIGVALDGVKAQWNNPDTFIVGHIGYTPSKIEAKDLERIVILYLNDDGTIAPVQTGRYSADEGASNGIVSFKATTSGKYAVAYVKKAFNDLAQFSWAKRAIEVLAAKGAISGTGTGTTYSPAAEIIRADYVMLLMRAMGFNAAFDSNYSDAAESDYFYKSLGIAKALGITGDMPDNNFDPRGKLTRQDMFVFTARALELAGKLTIDGTAEDLAAYTDASDIAPEAVEYIASLVKAGIISGSGGKISPLAGTNRAEMAVLIYKLYNMQ